VKWPAPEHWDDQQIERTLFPQRPAPAIWRKHPEPDWTQLHQELQTHKDLTLLAAASKGAKMAAPGGATAPSVDGSGCARGLPGRALAA
jgi:hypothetical protein